MTKVIVGMTISLDGFAADRNGSAGALYPDLEDLRDTDYMQAMIRETGAVLMGKRAFEMGDPDSYVGTYEFQVPIFVLTHEPPSIPPKQDEHLSFTFVTDGLESAVVQATRAAGGRAVTGVIAVTVAVRRSCSTSAISPKKSPGPSSTRCSPSLTTSTFPSTSAKNSWAKAP